MARIFQVLAQVAHKWHIKILKMCAGFKYLNQRARGLLAQVAHIFL